MATFTKRVTYISLDINRETGQLPKMVEGDTGNRFVVTLTENGTALDLTGLHCVAVFRRSDGKTALQIEGAEMGAIDTTNYATGKVAFDVLNGSFRDGKNFLEIQVRDDNDNSVLVTSARLEFWARNCLNNAQAVKSSDEYPMLDAIIDAWNALVLNYSTAEAGSAGSGSIALVDGAYVLTLNVPRGADGQDGVSPTARVEKIGKTATIIITDSDGTTTRASVSDGADGQDGVGISSITYNDGVLYITLTSGSIINIEMDDLVTDSEIEDMATKTWVAEQRFLTGIANGSITNDMLNSVLQLAIARANSAYQKPSGGIPSTDMTSAVQTSLGKADTAYQKPSGGIPNSDLETMVAKTIKGNKGNSAAVPADLTVSEVKGMLAITEGAAHVKYGQTTWADVSALITAGRDIIVEDSTHGISGLMYFHNSSEARFSAADGDNGFIYMWYISSTSGWNFATFEIPSVSTIPVPYASTPSAPTASGSSGSSSAFAKGDHAHPKEIFWATYDSTTYAEIVAADAAGKMVLCKYNGLVCALSDISGGTAYFKSPQHVGFILTLTVDSLVWDYGHEVNVSGINQAPDSVLVSNNIGEVVTTPKSAFLPKYTTLTLAVADWEAAASGYTCTKSVTGMTATAIVLLTVSDTETDFGYSQAAGTLTFTAPDLPSEAVTVNLAYQEGVALR